MTQAAAQGRGLLAAALARAGTWLLEPASPAELPGEPSQADSALRPVVCVFGLARGCGATVVARALASELAVRDPAGAAAVASAGSGGGIPLALPSAARLARVLADVPGTKTRAVGRLCLVEGAEPLTLADTARYHAPLVIDAGSTEVGGVPLAVADHLLLVAGPRLEPALAAVTATCLARAGPEPLVVLNRAPEEEPWSGRAQLRLPDSRMGAQLALAGRAPRGALGYAVAELADRCRPPR
ncbi:MAG: hypothetical protein ABR581_12280 [Thermoleophilaceae bacterium]